MTAIPAVVLLVGFIGAFMHLASPFAAFGVFGGIGSSPLSNEIVAALVFCVVAIVYWALALAGKLPAAGGARKALLIALAVLSLVFAVFCGLAYMMDTIPTWNTPASIVQMLGYAIAGGAAIGFTVLGFARVELPENAAKIAPGHRDRRRRHRRSGLGRAFAGLGSIRNIWGPASDLVPRIRPDHRAVCSMRNRRGGACVALLQEEVARTCGRRLRHHRRRYLLPVSPSTAPTWESRCSAAPRHVIGRTRRVSFGNAPQNETGYTFRGVPCFVIIGERMPACRNAAGRRGDFHHAASPAAKTVHRIKGDSWKPPSTKSRSCFSPASRPQVSSGSS